jgi:hypothetical protein
MTIDYEKLLREPIVRKILGKKRCAQEDPGVLDNFISENSKTILALGWDGNFPGVSGAEYHRMEWLLPL